MTGVSLHVLRKAMAVEKVQGSVGRKAGSPGSGEALLSGSETDSDVEVFHTTRWDGGTRGPPLAAFVTALLS